MDRDRFTHLIDAYGADFSRWPQAEREVAAKFAAAHAEAIAAALAEARALDAALASIGERAAEAPELLARRILKQRPRRMAFDLRAGAALAACAVFGVAIGYGGGLMAPVADADDSFFAMAFEAPFSASGDEG
jgi:hypothetical protein